MKEVPSLGIIGNGFIGSAVHSAFMHYTDVKVFDKNPTKTLNDYVDVISQDVLLLSLPTPMRKDGTVDCSIVAEALQKIEDNLPKGPYKPVVIKSTIPPNDMEDLMLRHGENLLVIYSPEFLTERSAVHEFIQSNRFIFGTLDQFNTYSEANLVAELFKARFYAVPQYWVPASVAVLVKYFTNIFFTSKVSLMNEFHQVTTALGVNFEDTMGLVMMDPRIGRSHYSVPGHDGKLGWGGSCFYKDLNGYLHIAKNANVDPKIGRAAWNKNVEVRGNMSIVEELNAMVGRASSNKMDLNSLMKLGDKK